ncbi:hypothetical protein OQA88_4178 [Cercophora sp. LCS_1]
MYQLACADGYKYPGSEPTYVTEIIPLATGLAATTSDQRLSLFNPLRLSQGPLNGIQTNHGNLTCARAYSLNDSAVATTGENGTISVWDLRLDPSNARALQIQGPQASLSQITPDTDKENTGDFPSLLSLACSHQTHALVAGTELANHQASIIIWYLPSPSPPLCKRSQLTTSQGRPFPRRPKNSIQRSPQRRRNRAQPPPNRPPHPPFRLNRRSRQHYRHHHHRRRRGRHPGLQPRLRAPGGLPQRDRGGRTFPRRKVRPLRHGRGRGAWKRDTRSGRYPRGVGMSVCGECVCESERGWGGDWSRVAGVSICSLLGWDESANEVIVKKCFSCSTWPRGRVGGRWIGGALLDCLGRMGRRL